MVVEEKCPLGIAWAGRGRGGRRGVRCDASEETRLATVEVLITEVEAGEEEW